jgi:hypothetical protein
MTITIKLTEDQLDTVIYELNQGLLGDNDPYERKLKTIIKKLEEAKENGKGINKKG